jgi:starvation-inducible outer membrane lipoprotein
MLFPTRRYPVIAIAEIHVWKKSDLYPYPPPYYQYPFFYPYWWYGPLTGIPTETVTGMGE